jgi:hypothetical protein
MRPSARLQKPTILPFVCCGLLVAITLPMVAALLATASAEGPDGSMRKGYDITETGLVPEYPAAYSCPPITSMYASWIDVDGTRRDEKHSGIDLGRLNDRILAPAPGIVRAAWETDWQWGREGALLIRHGREDLGLTGGAKYYYSEFDHLRYRDIKHFDTDEEIARGDSLAYVARPGGHRTYLPEVHWEVWEVEDDDALEWSTNKYGGRYWTNETARLIDPLYMMGLNNPPAAGGKVMITPYSATADYDRFRGFTYALQCQKR